VVFDYTGYNESGAAIDSSYRQGRPAETRLGIQGLIPGACRGGRAAGRAGARAGGRTRPPAVCFTPCAVPAYKPNPTPSRPTPTTIQQHPAPTPKTQALRRAFGR
jgi:hypothetical protein